jgi:hypothetical protein
MQVPDAKLRQVPRPRGNAVQGAGEPFGVTAVPEHPRMLEPARVHHPAQVQQAQRCGPLEEPIDRDRQRSLRNRLGHRAVGQLLASKQGGPVPAHAFVEHHPPALGLLRERRLDAVQHPRRHLAGSDHRHDRIAPPFRGLATESRGTGGQGRYVRGGSAPTLPETTRWAAHRPIG